MKDFITKISSRKFLLALAAFLASVGTSVAGLSSGNTTIATVGIICTVMSAAIYAGVEAYVDAASIKSSTTATTNTNVTSMVTKNDTTVA